MLTYTESGGRLVVREAATTNSNTPEMLREQYDSMVKERSVVDPSTRDPRFRQG